LDNHFWDFYMGKRSDSETARVFKDGAEKDVVSEVI
jgi:hypothetical protein